MEYIMVLTFFIFELVLFTALIIYSKFVNIKLNYFVGFRTSTALTNDETFSYANKIFNEYNIKICSILIFLSVETFIISMLVIKYFYIVYLPIFLLIISYFCLAFKINKMVKLKFNL